MKGVWDVLGLSPDSDRDAIRRAYAAKLRRTRPEEDPQGFIALREAYEAALGWADHRARFGDQDLDDDALDDEAGEDAWEDEDEPDLRTRIAPFRPGAVPWAVPSGAPAGATPEVEEGRGRLGKAAEALGRALGSPWRVDEERLGALFDAFVRALAEVDFGAREGAEFWLAEVLADNVPRSDPLLLPAAEAFGWHEDALERYPPAVHFLLARLEEWRLINMLRAPGHELEEGWRALTSARAPWRRRLHAAVPGVTGKVGTLLDIADWQAPGLSEFMNRDAARWWTDFLRRPHLSAAALFGALGCLGTAALAAVLLAGAPPATRWATAAVLALAAVAVLVLDLRLFSRWRGQWRDEPPSAWVTDGWAAALLVLPVFGILLPPAPWSVAGFSLLAAVTALWLFLFTPRTAGFETRPVALILIAGVVVLLGAAPFIALAPERQAVLAALGLLYAAVFFCRLGSLYELTLRSPVPPVAAAGAVTIVYLLLAGQLSGGTGATTPFFYFAPAIVLGVLVFNVVGEPGTAGGYAAFFARIVLMIGFMVAAGASVPPDKTVSGPFGLPLGIVPGEDRMVAVEEAQPAFAVLRRENPRMHAEVRAILERMDAGRITREQAVGDIDRLLTTAYRRALPTAADPLLVEEIRIRRELNRHWQTADPAACIAERALGPGSALPEPLRKRMDAHVINVVAASDGPTAGCSEVLPVPSAALVERAAEMSNIPLADLATLLTDEKVSDRDRCATRAKVLDALLSYPAERIAATLREQSSKPAANPAAGSKPTGT